MESSLTALLNELLMLAASLNPYSNGILSDTIQLWQRQTSLGLNPYSNGILSDLCKRVI